MAATEHRLPTETGTAVYLYGVVRSGVPSPSTVGDVRLHAIECGEIAAIASPVRPPVRVKRRDLLRHSEVAQAAFTRGTVLPFSFGTVFASEASVIEEFLQPHHDELVTLLQRFEGLGEMRLRAAYRKEAVLEEIVLADAGIARLSRATESTGPDDPRRIQLGQAVADALAARQRADADAIVAALVALAHDVEIEEAQSEFDVLYGSFLIELGQAATFDARLEQIARQHEGRILFKCTGPLPAHSFVSLGSAS